MVILMKIKILLMLLLFIPVSMACNMTTTIYLPAVQKTNYGYKGVMATAVVHVQPGSGHVFVDTYPLTEIDTQASARLARDVAFKTLEKNPNKYDVFYTIRSDSPIIGGPSAGGALTVATMAALLCLNVSPDAIMTGTINPDGSIGPVGGIFEKASAASEHGAKLFLLPKGQSKIIMEKTERNKIPFGVQIVTKPVEIDLKEYARENWNMSVVEISNVKDAIKYMTGYEIVEKKPKPVNDKKVKEIMKGISKNMLDLAEKKLSEAKQEINSARLPLTFMTQLKTIYSNAEDDYKNAESYYDDGNYYTAASMSFGVWIKCSYIENIVEYSNNNQGLKNKLSETDYKIKKIKKRINSTEINSLEDVEIIILSEERINEAQNYLDEAWKNYYNENYVDTYYDLAYAEERARTAEIWLNVTAFFDGNLTFNTSSLKPLAEKRLEDAKSSILYAKAIIGNVGNADELLENAENDYFGGDYASSIMNSMMAKALSDVYMETNGLQDKSKVNDFKMDAENSISEAESKGYIPFVAINYYDYANNLDDTASKLIYYKYADELAELEEYIDSSSGNVSESNTKIIIKKVNESKNYTSVYIAISVFIGFVIGKLTNKNVKKK